ncbi:MAG TPA: TlyA family RNA methyltransferase [Verrucomicrobiota bacterium]|nr:TlyA family RNA methyltransferase [Verrucomicrobiota bacterium]HNU49725.1 TlyA family RNA methyltransferase [Verrucomicrobiota bacterium]
MPPPLRLDQALVDRGLCESREKARRAVLAGQIRVNGRQANKPGQNVRAGDAIERLTPDRYVSRGGHKLEHALHHFALDVSGLIALDVGASTGGFTDCLLQHGAAHVYAVDVGRGQLAWKLRTNPRVTVLEGINARHLTPAHFPMPFAPPQFACVDCSFISLRLILPPVATLLAARGRLVALVKPQFEAGKAEADRGHGVIRDPMIHQRVLDQLATATIPGLHWHAVTKSPILGPAGNQEFLALLEKTE